jgi:hypothetical protein
MARFAAALFSEGNGRETRVYVVRESNWQYSQYNAQGKIAQYQGMQWLEATNIAAAKKQAAALGTVCR